MVIETEKLVRVRRYAEKYGYRRAMVYYWIRTGEIKSVQIDGYFFVIDT